MVDHMLSKKNAGKIWYRNLREKEKILKKNQGKIEITSMNPDWTKAPEWANYIAMDSNHEWYWHENEPEMMFNWWNQNDGKVELVGEHLPWKDSLQKRPEKQEAEITAMKARIKELEDELSAIYLNEAGESQ